MSGSVTRLFNGAKDDRRQKRRICDELSLICAGAHFSKSLMLPHLLGNPLKCCKAPCYVND